MGWATPIRDPQQVDYRLSRDCGCDVERDAQVEYRLAAPRDLRWIGSGLAELDLAPGEAVDPAKAKALMDGRDWRTGEQLVRRKQVLDPRGKLTARVLVDAVTARAAAEGISAAEYLGEDALAQRFARAERGIRRDGERHLVPVADAERLAAAAGLSLEELYGADTVAEARRWMHHHVDVGLRGVDIVLDLPKSISVAWGLASDELADAIEAEWMESVTEAVAALEQWTAYGMAGHHGDGQRAERIDTSGFLGWTTLHRSARPVKGAVGDPHLHVHVNIAHMARCADGTWRTIAAGAEDLLRHAHLVNEIAEARLRARLIERHGARFERSPDTGAWELAGIAEELRTAFSQRHAQVVQEAGEGATRDQQKAAARKTAEAKIEADAASERVSWRDRAVATLCGDVDGLTEQQRQAAAERAASAVDEMVAAALPGPDGPAPTPPGGGPRGPVLPTPQEIAEQIWDPEHGLVASKKVVGHTHVLSAVVQTLPYLQSVEQLTALTKDVLAVDGHAVRLRDSNRHHQVHRQRYTHTSVIEAENTLTESAAAGLGAGLAQLTDQAAELTIATVEVANSTPDRPFAFSAQQRAVIMRLLTGGHAVDAVLGVAGAGKTTLMQAARTGWEAAGLRVVGASTAAVAAANLAAEAGIDSRTIAAWTREISGGQGLAGVGVLVIDEAAMVDDRAMAALLRHAAETGTKVVGVGDPLQLRAVGIGGGFARVHELIDGLVLDENRRQTDPVERAALKTWREGGRTTALAMLAERGRIHAADTPEQTTAAMLAAWNAARTRWAGQPHEQLAELLLLAARRLDVEQLNAGARALRVAAGELAGDVVFRGEAGRIAFAPGDLVHVRRNDYRSRRGGDDPDVLNGFRGVALAADARRGVLVEWRRPDGSGGHTIQSAWMSPAHIAEGRLTHGYAMTIGSAQGLTSQVTIASGRGADAHSLYPALSRARQETHLFLPLAELEDDVTRRTLGAPRSDAERLDRAVAAYGRLLERDGGDVMVTDELTAAPVPDAAPRPERRQPDEQQQAAARQETAGPAPGAVPGQRPEQPQRPAVDPEAAEAVRLAAEAFPKPPQEALERFLAAGYASRTPEPAPEPQEAAQEPEDRPGFAERAEARRTALAESRARYLGDADDQPGAAEPEPDVPGWRERPHGDLATSDLLVEARKAEQAAAAARQAAAELTAQAEALRALLGTDDAPGRQSYARTVEHLDAAEKHLADADAADKSADGIDAQVKEMYATNRSELDLARRIRERAALWRMRPWRKGMLDDADALRERVEERTKEIETLREQATELRAAASTSRRLAVADVNAAAGGTTSHRPLQKRIDEQRAALPQLAERLDAADQQNYERLVEQASKRSGSADTLSERAEGLRKEAALREELPPGRKAREAVERAEAARRQAERRAAEQARRAAEQARLAEQRRQQQYYRYDPPSQGRSGPSLGR
jgi:conjugative relaxase-like TrwC/TraI family protein